MRVSRSMNRRAITRRLSLLFGLVLSSCAIACQSPDAPRDSGARLWTAGPSAIWRPASDGTRVFFRTIDHLVVAVDRVTGQQKWSRSTGMNMGNTGGNAVVAGNLVVVPDYDVFAFDRATGALAWKFAPENTSQPGYGAGAFGLAGNDSMVFAGGAGYAYALDARSGALLWDLGFGPESTTIVATPYLDGSTVYLRVRYLTNPITGELVVVDAPTGRILWRRSFTAATPGSSSGPYSVAATNDLVIVSIDDGTVHALEKASGLPRWTAARRPEVNAYDDDRDVVVVGNTVVAGSSTFFTTGYDVATGALLWERNAGQGSSASPLETDGTNVYVVYVNGALAALDGATGEVRWLIGPVADLEGFLPSPLVAGSVVYVPSHGGLVALRR